MLFATKLSYLLAMITLICAYKRGRDLKKGSKITNKIIGGKPAHIRNYPYMIRLEAKYLIFTTICGGAYIKPEWVITAAHCLDINDQTPRKPPDTGKKTRVKCIAGFDEARQRRKYQQLYSVDLFINPTYFRNDTDTMNDVGLIELSEPFRTSNSVQMIGMPMEAIDYSGGRVILIGWGASRETDRPERGVVTFPKNLQVLRSTVHDMQDCVKEMGSISVLCVGEQGKIACAGDSGGPLVHKRMVIGVCSYGFGCGEDTVVYENIYFHMDWIRNLTEYTARRYRRNGGGSRAPLNTVLSFSILNLFLRLD